MKTGFVCRSLGLLVGLFMMAACTSPHMSGELAAGKMAFQNGDYNDAFEHLLPVARTGRPEAEYAVGYMYYYGYGVQRDMAAGRLWIERAAAQHYALANQALDRMRHAPPEETTASAASSGPVTSGFKGAVAPSEAYTATPTPKPKPLLKAKPASVGKPSPVSHRKAARSCVPSSARYVLQLYGSWQQQNARQFAKERGFGKRVTVCRTVREGKDWYILVTGQFASMAEAGKAKMALPQSMKGLHPWVRPAKDLFLAEP